MKNMFYVWHFCENILCEGEYFIFLLWNIQAFSLIVNIAALLARLKGKSELKKRTSVASTIGGWAVFPFST